MQTEMKTLPGLRKANKIQIKTQKSNAKRPNFQNFIQKRKRAHLYNACPDQHAKEEQTSI